MTSQKTALAFDGEEEDLHSVETGILQGSPTSPILFIIYLQPLFVRLQQADLTISTLSYMDDVALVTQSPSLETNTATLEAGADIAFDWAAANAVAFDDPKSEIIHFHRKHNFTATTHQLRLPNRTMVAPKACLRWLGVWLDSKLSFKEHVKIKVAAAQRSLALICQLANIEKGPSVAGMRQLYQVCVVSVADYRSEVWWNGDAK